MPNYVISFLAFFVLTVTGLATTTAAADTFVVDDRVVSNPNQDLPAPEFDRPGRRMFWQDRRNRIWLAGLDSVTGDINPRNGRLLLIDDQAAPIGEVGNTPRISYGSVENVLVYTDKVGDQLRLAVAQNVGRGEWVTQHLQNGEDRYRINGTPEGFAGTAMIVYIRILPGGGQAVAWRKWDDPTSEDSVNDASQGGRFLGSERALVIPDEDADGVRQLQLVDLDTGVLTKITDSPGNKNNPFPWDAPEFGSAAILVMKNFRRLVIYTRNADGKWEEYNNFTLPTAKHLLSSAEAFVWKGKSYISVVAAEKLGTSGTFPGQPVGPTEIWIAGIDPKNPFFRRVDNPTREVTKSEPEPVLLEGGPVIYFTEKKTEESQIRLLRRAATGL